MCVHYLGVKDPQKLAQAFAVERASPALQSLQDPTPTTVVDIWPAQEAVFIRRPRGDTEDRDREAVRGRFGLIPHWAKDESFGKRTYNARSETVAEKPSYRDAWRLGRRCIIPAQAFFEPDWRSGKAVSTRISRADGEPMGIAGIWTGWKAPSGDTVRSFSMLTVNADDHPLMNQFHKPQEEKRMVVILREEQYAPWLAVAPVEASGMLGLYPALALVAQPAI